MSAELFWKTDQMLHVADAFGLPLNDAWRCRVSAVGNADQFPRATDNVGLTIDGK